jgi:hypothetical protein
MDPLSLYKPLDHKMHSIRLVEIQRDDNEMVSCILHNFNTLINCPPYTALSYTWGPDHPHQDIRVNGALFEVRENLWHALRFLKKLMQEGWFIPDQSRNAQSSQQETRLAMEMTGEKGMSVAWESVPDYRNVDFQYQQRNAGMWKYFYIDAICINQDDDLEKTHQVNLMAPIFKTASLVIAWLREGDGSGRDSFDWVKTNESDTIRKVANLRYATDPNELSKRAKGIGLLLSRDLIGKTLDNSGNLARSR